ncbi:MAG: carbohydrate ABC transporter permease [Candidatus Kapaibacterium sp.]
MRIAGRILLHAFLILIAAGMIFPMFWMILLSLREYPESFSGFMDLLTAPATLGNYIGTLESDAFDIYFLNSIIVALAVTAGNIVFCLFAGYALARRSFPGKALVFGTILGVLIIPPHIIMIPLYRLMVELGWINTYYSLIIPWLVTPFGVFLVRQYIIALPSEMEDAARIDGAGEWFVVFRIVMPLCKPILTVLAIYVFLQNWNSFLFPYLFTNAEEFRTLPVGLTFYLGKQSIDWGHLMAGAGISALPVLILFVIFQRQIIKGLTAGALKE